MSLVSIRRAAWLPILVTLVACGGGGRATGGETAPQTLSPPLRDFHEVFAPAWSAKPGAARVAAACEAAEKMAERARETKDSTLSSYTFTMQKECEDPVRDEVEGWLVKVHQRFRELADK